MYEDEDIWPIRCPLCGHGFTAKIRHLKLGVVTRCVSCSRELGHSTEEFYQALSEARQGKLNPWWDMLRRIAHHSPGPGETPVVQTPAKPDFDLVEQAFNLFLHMDAEQRAGLMARQQDRMARRASTSQPRRSPD